MQTTLLSHAVAAAVLCWAVEIGGTAYGQTATGTRVRAALLDSSD
jgi:hypothetical protein